MTSFVIFILLACLMIYAFIRSIRSVTGRKKQAQTTAGYLSLEFKDSFQDFRNFQLGAEGLPAELDTPQAADMISRHKLTPSQTAQYLNKPWLTKLMAMVLPWEISGKFNGTAVTIKPWSRKEQEKRFIEFCVFFQQPLAFELTIYSEGFADRLLKRVGSLEDVETGNSEFDKKVVIESSSQAQAKAWLASPARQQALISLFTHLKDSAVERQGISVKKDERLIEDQEKCGEILEHLTRAAAELERP